MVDKVLYREVVDWQFVQCSFRWTKRIDFERCVRTRSNADKLTEDEIDIGGVIVMMGARQADNRRASVRVIVLLNIGMVGGQQVLMRVLP
jgi:hypothetical protein